MASGSVLNPQNPEVLANVGIASASRSPGCQVKLAAIECRQPALALKHRNAAIPPSVYIGSWVMPVSSPSYADAGWASQEEGSPACAARAPWALHGLVGLACASWGSPRSP